MFSQHGSNDALIASAASPTVQFKGVFDFESHAVRACPETPRSRFATATAGGLMSKPST